MSVGSPSSIDSALRVRRVGRCGVEPRVDNVVAFGSVSNCFDRFALHAPCVNFMFIIFLSHRERIASLAVGRPRATCIVNGIATRSLVEGFWILEARIDSCREWGEIGAVRASNRNFNVDSGTTRNVFG